MSKHNDLRGLTIRAADLLSAVPRMECHVHTGYSDGQGTVDACVAQALRVPLSRIVFTEHAESSLARPTDWFAAYAREVTQAARRCGSSLDIILGLEAPAVDFKGSLDINEEMREQVGFLLGAAHRYPGIGNRRVRDLTADECVKYEFETLMGLTDNREIAAIAHVGATCAQFGHDLPREMLVELVRAATGNGVAIELNARHHRPLTRVLEVCLEENALVTLGSDAHTPQQVGMVVSVVQNAVRSLSA